MRKYDKIVTRLGLVLKTRLTAGAAFTALRKKK
jgi:hypothetical protein